MVLVFFNLPASCNFFPLLQLASAKHNFNNHCSWKCFPRMDLHKNGNNGSCPSSCGPLTEYYIPDYILKPDSEPVIIDNAPCCPVVVFINSRSGGQLGSSLIKTYRELLNEAQVFDLSEESPDKVLHRLYCNFEKLKCNGDLLAIQVQKSLRLIVSNLLMSLLHPKRISCWMCPFINNGNFEIGCWW